MGMNITQRDFTRNQSYADYESKKLCAFDNRFVEGVFKNTGATEMTLSLGTLVARSTSVVNGFIPITSSNLEDVIGAAFMEGDVNLAANSTASINIVVSGDIYGTGLSLPSGVTLDTVVGNKSLKDVLSGLGLHVVEGSIDHTKFDN